MHTEFVLVGRTLGDQCIVPSADSNIPKATACAVADSICNVTAGSLGHCTCVTSHYKNGENCVPSKCFPDIFR